VRWVRRSTRTALVTTRPCRALHHTISDVRLIGDGHILMPGDMSLAYNDVLFLDELPKFHRQVLEVLRQPLEESVICIQSRGRAEYQYFYGLRRTAADLRGSGRVQ
jgi:magnesium chelatase family protein